MRGLSLGASSKANLFPPHPAPIPATNISFYSNFLLHFTPRPYVLPLKVLPKLWQTFTLPTTPSLLGPKLKFIPRPRLWKGQMWELARLGSCHEQLMSINEWLSLIIIICHLGTSSWENRFPPPATATAWIWNHNGADMSWSIPPEKTCIIPTSRWRSANYVTCNIIITQLFPIREAWNLLCGVHAAQMLTRRSWT